MQRVRSPSTRPWAGSPEIQHAPCCKARPLLGNGPRFLSKGAPSAWGLLGNVCTDEKGRLGFLPAGPEQ